MKPRYQGTMHSQPETACGIRGSHSAVSEILGTVILISIVVAAVSIVGVALWSQPHPQKIPALSAIISNRSCSIYLYHNGGDMLDRDSFQILVDGTDQTANFTMRGVTGSWVSWVNGDILEYAPSVCSRTPERADIVFNDGSSMFAIASAFFGSYLPTGGLPNITPPTIPVANFDAVPLTGPVPLTVQFTDTSSGSPTSWSWTFGDGNISTQQNPVFTYSIPGTYTVSLTVNNVIGSDAIIRPNLISAGLQAPVASFISNRTSGLAPLAVQFNDTTSGLPASWSWTFGDGGISADQNPSYSYTNAGTYTVSLTASNAMGSNTTTKTGYIIVNQYSPGIVASYYSDQTWTTPAGKRVHNRIRFADTASGAQSDISNWPVDIVGKADDFSVSFDGMLLIDNETDYTFYLTSDDGSWLDIDGSPLIDNGGDHGPTEKSVTVHLTQGFHTISTRMYENGGGAVILLEYSAPGISRQIASNLYHTPIAGVVPTAGFTGTPTSGPAPLSVQFTDTSIDADAWSWDFGDGTPLSHYQSPVHSYTSSGSYSVTLTVSNMFGSSNITKPDYISVGTFAPGLIASYYSDQTWTTLAGKRVHNRIRFADTGSGAASDISGWPQDIVGRQDDFSVSFDGMILIDSEADYTFYLTSDDGSWLDIDGAQVIDNGGLHGPTEKTATVHLTSGLHPTSVRMYENGGGAVVYLEYSSPLISRQFVNAFYHVPTIAPTADFTASPRQGIAPLTVQFTDASIDATSWSWNFGDSGTSAAQNPSHIYTVTGNYSVSLIATNAYGSSSVTKTGYIQVGSSFVPGFVASYYSDMSWTTLAGTRSDSTIHFADTASGYGSNEASWPQSIVGKQDTFSVIWDGYLLVPAAADYTFRLTSDDGSWLWVDETQVIDNGGDHAPQERFSSALPLTPGYHHVVVKMYENGGGAVAYLDYIAPPAVTVYTPVSDIYHVP